MYFDQPLALLLYATTVLTTRFDGIFLFCFSGGFLKNILFLAYFYVLRLYISSSKPKFHFPSNYDTGHWIVGKH